jgi:hypothetical protein
MNASQSKEKSRTAKAAFWLLNNGPAIITVLGSAALAVSASIIKLSELQILQAVVVLLAMIGTSMLTERLIDGRTTRERLEELTDRLNQVLAHDREIELSGIDSLIIRRRDLPPLEDRLDGAIKVDILGGSLFRLANEYRSLFEKLAESGCKLRFLLTDPETDAAEFLSSAVVYESSDVSTYRAQMRATLVGLCGLTVHYPHSSQVKLYAIAPPFSLVMVEKENEISTIQVELYPFRIPARDRPMFLLEKQRDPRLHRLFASQFEAMWSSEYSRVPDQAIREPNLEAARPEGIAQISVAKSGVELSVTKSEVL